MSLLRILNSCSIWNRYTAALIVIMYTDSCTLVTVMSGIYMHVQTQESMSP